MYLPLCHSLCHFLRSRGCGHAGRVGMGAGCHGGGLGGGRRRADQGPRPVKTSRVACASRARCRSVPREPPRVYQRVWAVQGRSTTPRGERARERRGRGAGDATLPVEASPSLRIRAHIVIWGCLEVGVELGAAQRAGLPCVWPLRCSGGTCSLTSASLVQLAQGERSVRGGAVAEDVCAVGNSRIFVSFVELCPAPARTRSRYTPTPPQRPALHPSCRTLVVFRGGRTILRPDLEAQLCRTSPMPTTSRPDGRA